jgi:hypothetical protein
VSYDESSLNRSYQLSVSALRTGREMTAGFEMAAGCRLPWDIPKRWMPSYDESSLNRSYQLSVSALRTGREMAAGCCLRWDIPKRWMPSYDVSSLNRSYQLSESPDSRARLQVGVNGANSRRAVGLVTSASSAPLGTVAGTGLGIDLRTTASPFART